MNLVDNHLPTFEIKPSIAEKTIYGMGEKSKSTNRLLLKNDLRFAINALEIHSQENFLVRFVKTLHAWCWFVKVHSADGREIWLNVGSLAKRLEITKGEVKQLKNRPFAELIARLENHAKSMNTAEEQIRKNEGLRNPSDLVKKIIPEEKIQLLFKKLLYQHSLSGKLQTEHTVDGAQFRAKIQDGRICLIQTSTAKVLGKGCFGTAYRVLDLTTGTFKVFKRFKEEQLASVPKYIAAFRSANPNNEWNNVALKPEVEFDDGYLTKEYKTDLAKWLAEPERTIEEKVNVCLQLARGLFQLSQEHIVHGDIKPANIFIDIDQNGEPLIRFADLDCSRKNNQDNLDYLIYTPGYAYKPDIDQINAMNLYLVKAVRYKAFLNQHKPDIDQIMAISDDTKKTEQCKAFFNKHKIDINRIMAMNDDPKKAEQYKAFLEKHDMFSTGITMYEVLTGTPLALVDNIFDKRTLERSLSRLTDKEAKRIIDLVNNMISFDHAIRPTPLELAQLSETIFKPEIDDDNDD